MTKYVFVAGGVMSEIGKGVVASAIAKCLQARHYSINVAKLDPYINIDAGMTNPYQYGEVFVTDDGSELDVDFGNYERMLDLKLSKKSSITTGQIYSGVIHRERKGEFPGQTVQIIPHVTDEIKRRIKEMEKGDITFLDVGGTVGDIESLPFLEAIRQMRNEEPCTCLVYVTYAPSLFGEQKTKPTQHSMKELREIGLQPDIVICRSETKLDDEARKRIALFSNLSESSVLSLPILKTIYEAPLFLDKQDCGEQICRILGLENRVPAWMGWEEAVNLFINPKNTIRAAILAEGEILPDSYVSVKEALSHAAAHRDARVDFSFIQASQIEGDSSRLGDLKKFDGIVVPGSSTSGWGGKILAIKFARENNIPLLCTGYGMHACAVEFARNVCTLSEANSTEVNPETSEPVIVAEEKPSLGTMPTKVSAGTAANKIYGAETIYERHRHRARINQSYMEKLKSFGLVFSGLSPKNEADIIELTGKEFFIATQFNPEFLSRPQRPSPVFLAFTEACLSRKRA